MRRFAVDQGDYIYQSDDASGSIYLVKSGMVEMTTQYPETGEGVDPSMVRGTSSARSKLLTAVHAPQAPAQRKPVSWLKFPEELMEILYDKPEKSLILGKSTFEHLRALYDDSSLDSDLERLREEMHVSIRDAVVAHESRVEKP